MFKIPDLRGKILFTLAVIALYRLGSHVPTPGVDFEAVENLSEASQRGGVLGFLNLFSGGALTRFAVFGLGIMPYITSSIIMQLLQVVIPKLEEWREQGAVGQRKLTQATRYVTVALALMQSTALAFAFHSGAPGFLGGGLQDIDLIPDFTVPRVLMVVLSMTAGTAMVMWLGELITQRGIGQGMSIVIFSSVVSGLPAGGAQIRAQVGWVLFVLIMVLVLAVLVAIVFVEQGQRRIPVDFPRRAIGRHQHGGHSSYIPLKLNQAGVVPIIFASSLLQFPVLISNVLPDRPWAVGVQRWINSDLLRPDSLVYVMSYTLLIVAFAYFYGAMQFDPYRRAEELRKSGGYVRAIHPGRQTARHLERILQRLTLPGALFLAFIALLPSLALAVADVDNFPFAGTTLLIAVSVALETIKQVDSQLLMRNYDGFLEQQRRRA
jgi:preprotein translocase subunit SecY